MGNLVWDQTGEKFYETVVEYKEINPEQYEEICEVVQ